MTTPSLLAMSTDQLTITHTSTVTPDQIDELGHMNVRYYGQNAAAATDAMCRDLALGSSPITASYTRHHHEQLEGNQLEVRSGLLAGGDRLRFYHELRNCENDDLAATFVHELDHPLIEMPTIELPDYGRARSIDLNTNRLETAPALDTLHALGLAIRLERNVSTEDSMGAPVVPPWLTNNLIWGGERPEGESSWIQTTDDGDRVAFASMETRLRVARQVQVGTRVQSFSAAISIGEKILHELAWVFDLDTEEVVAVAETIDLAFSIPRRRARSIPPKVRAEEESRLHPELG